MYRAREAPANVKRDELFRVGQRRLRIEKAPAIGESAVMFTMPKMFAMTAINCVSQRRNSYELFCQGIGWEEGAVHSYWDFSFGSIGRHRGVIAVSITVTETRVPAVNYAGAATVAWSLGATAADNSFKNSRSSSRRNGCHQRSARVARRRTRVALSPSP